MYNKIMIIVMELTPITPTFSPPSRIQRNGSVQTLQHLTWNHYIVCTSDTWWRWDMQINALACYENPTEGIWLICPIDFQHVIVCLRARQMETHSAWPQGLIWLPLHCDFKFIIHAIFYLSTWFHGWRNFNYVNI